MFQDSSFGPLSRPAVAFTAAAVLVLAVSAPAIAAPAPGATYTVEDGDTLSEIADRYDVSLGSVFALNGLGWDSLIHPGDTIELPGAPDDADAPVEQSAAAGTHTVRSGDTLGRIAEQHGVALETVLELNGLSRSTIIHPGDILRLGGSGERADSQPGRGSSIQRGPNSTNRVVLTYDDCPSSLQATEDVLAFAERSDIGLVIAPTGDCIRSFQTRYGVDLVAWVRGNGQYVINHSASHRDLTTLDCAGGADELGGPGVATNFGRPPYGALNSAAHCAYAQMGMSPWLWTVDTRDWAGKSEDQVVAAVVGEAQRGDTVLMHLQWNGFSPSAIRRMREGLAERGVELCRAFPGTSPVDLPAVLPC